MQDSSMVVDQNMVCGSDKDERDHFPRIRVDVSLFSGIHQICFLLIHPRKVMHFVEFIKCSTVNNLHYTVRETQVFTIAKFYSQKFLYYIYFPLKLLIRLFTNKILWITYHEASFQLCMILMIMHNAQK